MDEAMDWAVKIEEKLMAFGLLNNQNGAGRNLPNYPSHRPPFINPKSNPPTFTHKNYPVHSQNPNSSHPQNHRNYPQNNHYPNRHHPPENTWRLSDREYQDRKSKGLCYRCDEKWRVGHTCKRKELSVLIVAEDEEEEGDFVEASNEPVEDEPITAGISLSSVVGIDNPRTMKLQGRIGGNKVIVMIDPGATHNFISPEIIAKFKIPVDPTEEFGVTLGTGETRVGTGRCKNVEVDLGAMQICENFLPLELGHSDIILGVEWLAKLGTVSTNWKTPLMQFNWHGSKVILRGDPSLERSLVTLKSMMKVIRKSKGGILVELRSVQKEEL